MAAKGLYIQMFSVHGLLRSKELELGRDADTGGQIKYVVELAKALGEHEAVRQVDLFTLLIVDKTISEDYARPIETIGPKSRIVRIQCGGRKYMRKELLWPHLDEYIDKSIRFIKQEQRIPDVVHGHYPDAGYVAAMLAEIFGLPMVYTGHSLGRSKLERLLNEGLKQKEIVKRYKIDHRIQMEEEILKRADLVVTSTHQEINVQYAQYEHKDLPAYKVIPPGLDIEKFYNDGGPLDILHNCRNGQLVDTTRPEAIAAAVKKIIANRKLWEKYSQSGVTCIRKHYTWRSHAAAYAKNIQKALRDAASAPLQKAVPSDAIGRRLAGLDKFLITGIDTVIDEKENAALERLLVQVKQHREQMGFGINTNRNLDAATEVLEIHGISPDILICSAGTEFYYGERRHYGKGWETHISAQWKRDVIVRLIEEIEYVSYRPERFQGPFKVSYEMSPGKDRLARIHDLLLRNRCRCTLIYDEDRYLDILPYRASKGKAIRYLAYQWDIPLAHFLVCGSSYSDADLLRGEPTKRWCPVNPMRS